jgi:thiamine biosynthesis lipoprotein
MRITAIILIVALCAPAARSHGQTPLPTAVRRTVAMGTFLTISVHDSGQSPERIHALIDSAFAEVRRIELFASNYIDTTEIGRINRAAGRDTVAVSEELVWLLRECLRYGVLSGGKFDITIGPLIRLWGFTGPAPEIPDSAAVDRARLLTGQGRIVLGDGAVHLPSPGMEIDLGAIGKGYAVDRAAEVLSRNGLRRFIVDLGGNLGVRWEGEPGSPAVEIRHPRQPGTMLGEIRGVTGGVATSGDYERFFVRDGVRYHHIIDPATGFPSRGVAAVTIVAPDAMSADALSTIVFLLGPGRGMELVSRIPGVECLMLLEEKGRLECRLSAGLRERFVPAP